MMGYRITMHRKEGGEPSPAVVAAAEVRAAFQDGDWSRRQALSLLRQYGWTNPERVLDGPLVTRSPLARAVQL